MLYVLFRPLADQFILFNLFRYITFRAGAACMTALIVSFLMGPGVIRWLKSGRSRVSRSGWTDRNGIWSKRKARPRWAAC